MNTDAQRHIATADALIARAARATQQLSDAALADAFRALANAPDQPPSRRLTKSLLQEELERRNPAITAATNAWVDDLDSTATQDDIVLRFL